MKRALTLAFLLATAAAPLHAQSVLSIPGLGVPQPPLDAAARALGGTGMALFGMNGSLVNPAASAGVARRGVIGTFESAARTVEVDSASDEIGSTRFPLVHVFLPFGERWVVDAGFGGFMDQSWAVVVTDTIDVNGGAVPVRDLVESRGGISQIRVGASYAITPRLAVGVAGGVYTGERDLRLQRTFDDSAQLAGFGQRIVRSYTAPLLSAGLRWDPFAALRVAAALTWAGDLSASDSIVGEDANTSADYAMPLQLAAGVSAGLAPALTATLGIDWAGWEASSPELLAHDAWRIGGGVEWEGPRLGANRWPIRIGGSRAQLPFGFDGEAPTEWAAAVGLGLRFAGEVPLARIDAAVERGARDAGAAREDFWRITLSLALQGR